MNIRVSCPNCNAPLKVRSEQLGIRGKCPICNQPVVLTEQDIRQPASPASEASESNLPDDELSRIWFELSRIWNVLSNALGATGEYLSAGLIRILSHESEVNLSQPIHEVPLPIDAAQQTYEDVPFVNEATHFIECPFCAETIRKSAKKCKHCHEILDVILRAAQAPSQPVIYISNSSNASNSTPAVPIGRPEKRWDPAIAFVLSLLIPGLGQLYKGQVLNGLVWFVIVGIGYLALIIPGPILHFFCVLGAAMGDPYR